MSAMKTMEDLFIHELKDLYSAEKQLVKALPKMAKAASNQELRTAFEEHLHQTEEQFRRVEELLNEEGASTRGSKCVAMEGLIEEGKSIIEEDMDDEVRDAALIAAAQRVEHYEIAAYGCARTFAEQLGKRHAAQLLQQTLDEEKEADDRLTHIAMSRVNVEAGSSEGD